MLLDSVSVNGQNVSLNSSTQGVPQGKSVAVLDTGATDASIPKFLVDAIFSQMPEAVFNETSKQWIIPCNSTADVRFIFGCVDFHSLSRYILTDDDMNQWPGDPYPSS